MVQARIRSGPGSPARGLEPERHRQGRVGALAVGIVEPRLEVRERRLHGPAIGHDPIALVDEALVPQRLERPDHAFHEALVHGAVGVLEAHPAGRAVDVPLPIMGVALHREPALLVELRDAVIQDRGAPEDLDLLLDLEFGRQAVAVPAEAALDVAPAHRLVARHDVLDEAGGDVPVVRQAVGEGRAVVEHEFVRAAVRLGLGPHRDLPLERALALPPRQNLLLDGREARSLFGIGIGLCSGEHRKQAFGVGSVWMVRAGTRARGRTARIRPVSSARELAGRQALKWGLARRSARGGLMVREPARHPRRYRISSCRTGRCRWTVSRFPPPLSPLWAMTSPRGHSKCVHWRFDLPVFRGWARSLPPVGGSGFKGRLPQC